MLKNLTYFQATMTLVFSPLPLPSSVDQSQFENLGKEVKGVDLSNMTVDEFNRIENALRSMWTPSEVGSRAADAIAV